MEEHLFLQSWRDYHWEDEEDIESAADRYEKREIEKFNRAARAKKKKTEMARIRKMVDLAYDADPRIGKSTKYYRSTVRLSFKWGPQNEYKSGKRLQTNWNYQHFDEYLWYDYGCVWCLEYK